MDELFEKMRAYFEECDRSLKNDPQKKVQIASPEGLCLELDMKLSDFKAMESSEDEGQVDFYREAITRYAALCNQYQAVGLMNHNQRDRLDKTWFNTISGDDKTGIVVIFPNWNAPDDWEDYVNIKDYCKDHGMTVRDLLRRLTDEGDQA